MTNTENTVTVYVVKYDVWYRDRWCEWDTYPEEDYFLTRAAAEAAMERMETSKVQGMPRNNFRLLEQQWSKSRYDEEFGLED